MYQTTIQELEKAYKPYLDKSGMDRRIQEMKEEMEHLKIFGVQDKPSLFVWAKNMSALAMRAIIYVETEYPQELERKNSFTKQKMEEQKTELDSAEQMELQMGG